jgi:hypothetical protein
MESSRHRKEATGQRIVSVAQRVVKGLNAGGKQRYRQPMRTRGETIAPWGVKLESEPKSVKSIDITASPAKNRNTLPRRQPNAHAVDQPTW